MIRVTPKIVIKENELEEKFIHSSGPGGQNVNKTATAVQLRFDAKNNPSLPAPVRRRLLRREKNRISSEGILIIDARRFRKRERNRRDARDRLKKMIRQAARTPRRRRPTRPGRSANERRLKAKKIRSEKKRRRRPVSRDE